MRKEEAAPSSLLMVNSRPVGAGQGSPAADEAEEGPQTRVLVVDDEATLRDLLAEALTEDGYEVVTVSTGTEALEKLRCPGEDFPIVISDLKLPGANGVEVLREARSVNAECAVIIMTGYATVESAVECMKAGAMDYITKPLKLDELRMIVQRAAERLFLLGEAEKKKYYEELSRLDGLTQVFNHRYFHQLLAAELEHAKRFVRPLSLLMLDIDDFKRVNDSHGHQVGDHVLKALASLLTVLTRQTDYVSRYGGEEFTIILTETDKERAAAIGERIRSTVAEHEFQPEGLGKEIRLTASIGVAAYPQDAEEGKELISGADAALYAAKAAGKNALRAFQR